jgi:hypothetical protein
MAGWDEGIGERNIRMWVMEHQALSGVGRVGRRWCVDHRYCRDGCVVWGLSRPSDAEEPSRVWVLIQARKARSDPLPICTVYPDH